MKIKKDAAAAQEPLFLVVQAASHPTIGGMTTASG
jgi:hypothetical protein